MWAHVSFVLSQSTRLTDGQEYLGNTVRCITHLHAVAWSESWNWDNFLGNVYLMNP